LHAFGPHKLDPPNTIIKYTFANFQVLLFLFWRGSVLYFLDRVFSDFFWIIYWSNVCADYC